MNKFILFFALSATIAWGQTYMHDYQKEIELPTRGVDNYTLTQTTGGGYATASIVQNTSGQSQSSVLVSLLDNAFNVQHLVECDVVGIGNGTVFEPRDIIQNSKGNLIICGVVIIEGADNGGFLMHVSVGRTGLTYDWMKIYPVNPSNPDADRIMSATDIIEIGEGYVLTGRVQSIPYDGVIFGVDRYGESLWSRKIYDNEYGGESSIVNDIIKMDEERFAVIATVNGFPADDADIMVATFTEAGDEIGYRVYQNLYEPKEKYWTYREYGSAISYDRNRDQLTIAGTVEQKRKGVCVAAEYRKLLVFNINATDLSMNWTNTYDVNADLLIANEGLRLADMAYDPEESTYALAGSVLNDVFGKTSSLNGYILRIHSTGAAIDIRYYGTNNAERLERIVNTNEDGTFAAAGSRRTTSSRIWMVESYKNIMEHCDQYRSTPEKQSYKLGYRRGYVKETLVESQEFEALPMSPFYAESVICEKLFLGKALSTPEAEMKSNVYPTVTNDFVTIELTTGSALAEVYQVATGKLVIQKEIQGNGHVDLTNLSSGMYMLTIQGENAIEKFKLIRR